MPKLSRVRQPTLNSISKAGEQGPNKYYGTDDSQSAGYHPVPLIGIPNVLDNLVAAWTMDESLGDPRLDVSGNDYHLSVAGPGEGGIVATVTGRVGNAANFAPNDTRLSIPVVGTPLRPGAVEFMMIGLLQAGNDPWGVWNSTTDERSWRIVQLPASGDVLLQYSTNGSNFTNFQSGIETSPNEDGYFFVAVWFIPGFNTLWVRINDQTAVVDIGTDLHTSSANFCIGGRDDGNGYYAGRADETGFWSQYNADIVDRLYNGGDWLPISEWQTPQDRFLDFDTFNPDRNGVLKQGLLLDPIFKNASFTAERNRLYLIQAGASDITVTMPEFGPVGFVDFNGVWGSNSANGDVILDLPLGHTFAGSGGNTKELYSRPGKPSHVTFDRGPNYTVWHTISGDAAPGPLLVAQRYIDMSINAGDGPEVGATDNIPMDAQSQSDNERFITYNTSTYVFTIQKTGLWTVEWQPFTRQFTGIWQPEITLGGSQIVPRDRKHLNNEFGATVVSANKVRLTAGGTVYFRIIMAGGSTVKFYDVNPSRNNYCRFIYEGEVA